MVEILSNARTNCAIAIFLMTGSAITASVRLDVPFVAQVKEGCGSAAVAMVIQYWAQRESSLRDAAVATEQIDRMLPASAKGIQGNELKQYLEKHGFDAFIFNGEASDLTHHLKKGRPIVVCLAASGANKPLHYAVVVGIDDSSVWLNDGARGKLFSEDRALFAREWKVTGGWALLAVPRQQR